MENRSLLKKYEIPISHLDFNYISKCTNIKELERIILILRSGEEGYYPELTKCAEEKLKELKPDSIMLRKEERVLTKNSLSREEWEEHSFPIFEWSTAIKTKDAILSTIQESCDSRFDDLPPIRKSGRVSKINERIADSAPSCKHIAMSRPATTNYHQWEKYDADAEILRMELEDERMKEHVERKNTISKEFSMKSNVVEDEQPNPYRKLYKIEREKITEDYKILGNECFKLKEYTEALEYYSRCIQILPTATGYNNRAITNIKLKRYTDAISDCDNCLQRDSNNVKALLRKAFSLLELGKKFDAYQTYKQVELINPNNTVACNELEKLESELGEFAPLHATRIRITENESVNKEKKKVENSQPDVVDYDLAELIKPNKVVKSKLVKTMESLSKITSNKDGKAKPMATERNCNPKTKESKPEFELPFRTSSNKSTQEKLLIQEL